MLNEISFEDTAPVEHRLGPPEGNLGPWDYWVLVIQYAMQDNEKKM